MKTLPPTIKYTTTHEWIKLENNETARVGITAHAQASLGDIVFVNLNPFDELRQDTTPQILTKGMEVIALESVKAAADVYAPLSGTLLAVNHLLEDQPELINSDPYGQGWLFLIRLTDAKEIEILLDADAYQAHLDQENH